MRIGVDVGGTNTDAVLMDGSTVAAKAKVPTTLDVTAGIAAAVRALRAPPNAVGAVMIGTTHFTNAVVQRIGLAPVAAVRLGLPATASLPPMVDWPEDLKAAIGGHAAILHGGHEFDGREIAPLDDAELRATAEALAAQNVRQCAVSAVFAPIDAGHEQRAAARLAELVPGLEVTCSSEIGRMGLLQRENAAILNAALRPLAKTTVDAFEAALTALGLVCPLYLTQNDGTLMAADYARRFPVLTFASGPTNSMRGAAFLSGLRDAIVVDVGGTTTDVGELVAGFPREAALEVQVAGVRTNFRMPDLVSIGLGGGSLVTEQPLAIGPRSVGYELTTRARAFGGTDLTATDLVVAAGALPLQTGPLTSLHGADPSRVADLDPAFLAAALDLAHATIEAAVDRIRSRRDPRPLIAVGGGSILLHRAVAGTTETLRPPHHEVANAIGAAIAQVSGDVDRVFALTGGVTRERAIAAARDEAAARATAAGADPTTIEIVEVDEVPLSYLPGNATRVRAKAVGDLAAG